MFINTFLHRKVAVFQLVFACYWFIAFFFFYIFYGRVEQSTQSSFAFSASFLFISFLCVDIHSRFVTKPYFRKKQYKQFLLFSTYIFIAAFWLECVLSFLLHIYFWDFNDSLISEQAHHIRNQIGGVNMIVFGGVSIRLVKESFQLQSEQEIRDKLAFETKLKLREVELDLLKSQVNPHFLFNALNCIYGLSLEKSELTPEVILQLSAILDYILYKSEDQVLLSDELRQIENYIAIQEVRFGKSLVIDYNKEVDVDSQISPLVLLTLVENAFKHGRLNKEDKLVVTINVTSGDELCFFIENSIDEDKMTKHADGGIGLVNLKRRLALLYPDKYKLSINSDSNFYSVSLNIALAQKKII